MRTRFKLAWIVTVLAACGGSDEVENDTDLTDGGDVSPDIGDDVWADTSDVPDTADTTDAADGADATDAADTSDVTDAADADDASELDTSDAEDATDTTPGPDTDVPTGTIRGLVTEALTSQTIPLEGIKVRVGGLSTTTDSNGRFELLGTPTGEVVVIVEPPASLETTWSSGAHTVRVARDGVSEARFELLRGCRATVDVSAGAGVVLPASCGAQDAMAGIELPEDSVVDALGNPVSNVRVDLVPMPVTGALGEGGPTFVAFPGDMSAIATDGSLVFLESRGALEVRLWNADTNEPAKLAEGATATIRFSATDIGVNDEFVVPMWSFDPIDGVWDEAEGVTARLEVDPFTSRLMYRAEVDHFSWWNADIPASRACVTGRLLDSTGEPIAHATSRSWGVDYAGSSSAQSAADGRFSVFARASSEAVVAASVQIGAREVRVERTVRTPPDDTTCVDLGDLQIDTASVAACARGSVLDESGAPVARVDVVARGGGLVYRTISADDGGFCLPVPSDLPFDVAVSGVLGGKPALGWARGFTGVAGGGYCDEGGGCQDLGSVTIREFGCVTGSAVDESGPVSGALLSAVGSGHTSFATSAADGTYCMPAEQGGRVDVFGLVRGFFAAPSRYGQTLDLAVPATPGDCSVPRSCAISNVLLTDLTCVSGTATGPDGEPLAGARVSATPTSGGLTRTVLAGSDGTFCVPAPVGEQIRVEVNLFADGARYTADSTYIAGSTAGACALDTCTELGTLRADRFEYSICVTGTLLDGSPAPYNDVAHVAFASGTVTATPDRSGRFCVALPPTAEITIEDRVPRDCFVPRGRDFSVSEAPAGGDCTDRSGCLDIGELDFADFCFFS